MASLLAKRIYYFFPSSLHGYHYQRHQYLSLLPTVLRLPLSTQSQQSKEEIPFIAQYLVSSFGFSLERALKVSSNRNLTGIKTEGRPDSIVSILEKIGLSDSQIRSLISFEPTLLSLSVEKTIKPQIHALIDAGFAGEVLIQLIRRNPRCLCLKGTLSRLQFWRSFVGDCDDTLLKLIQRNGLLITFDIDQRIMPRIDLLKEYGMSDQEIVKLITMRSRFLLRSLDSINWALNKTEELGISRGSNMFLYGLHSIGTLNKEKLEKRMAVFIEMHGWSKEDVYTAFRKCHNVFTFSEENIKLKMDFLIKRAGLEPRSIASQPILLTCSAERKLIPRHNVLSALKAKGLETKCTLLGACVISEKRFLERFVTPYKKDMPEIGESYAAACAGKLLN